MCGISALISTQRLDGDKRLAITRMTNAQRHRGPDHSAIWEDERVALGHNRLRVIDPNPRSDQPFYFASQPTRGVLVYNGELYNHHELRHELIAAGEPFETQSDTEILFRALIQWGEDALEKLKGMFAFVFYQPEANRVMVARDKMGIKPLYIARNDDAFLFASEARGIFASQLVSPNLDPHGIVQIARYNHLLGNATAFEGVEAVPPGSVWHLDLQSGKSQLRRYFFPKFTNPNDLSFSQRAERLNEAFVSAVDSHLDADIPVGLFMSGGLDSTGLASEASRQSGSHLSTYSLVFPGQSYSEEDHIAHVLHDLPVSNERVPIEDVTLDEYIRFVSHAEMPQLWTTDLALKRLSSAVANAGHRVVLSGEGPDELLAGYDSFRWGKLRKILDRMWLSPLIARLPKTPLRLRSLTWFEIDTAMLRFYAEQHEAAKDNELTKNYGFHPENLPIWNLLEAHLPTIFHENLRSQLHRFKAHDQKTIRSLLDNDGETDLQKNLLFEVRVRLANWVLPLADRMSSAHGVELRVPYLDDDFVRAALDLPDSDRLRGMNEKYILKHIHKNRVPKFIRKRHKQALYTPISEWVGSFFDDAKFERYWSPARFARSDYFSFEAANKTAQKVRENDFQSLLDRLVHEWSFLLILSTHIVEDEMLRIASDESLSRQIESAKGI